MDKAAWEDEVQLLTNIRKDALQIVENLIKAPPSIHLALADVNFKSALRCLESQLGNLLNNEPKEEEVIE